MSNVFIIPIVAIAAFVIYRYVRGAWVGSGTCHNCSSRHACGMTPQHHAAHTATSSPTEGEENTNAPY